MRTSFRQANFEELATLWNSLYPANLQLGAAELETNTVGSPAFDWGSSSLHVDDDTGKVNAFAALKQSAHGICKAGDPDEAHICALACASPEIGVDLIAFAKGVLRNRGAYLLHFGNDYHCILPGCPNGNATLQQFLMIEGFEETRTMYDLALDLTTYSRPTEVVAGDVRVLGAQDLTLLKGFLHAEFAGRTAHEVVYKIQEEGRCDFAYGLFHEGRIVGFAMTQDATHKAPHRSATFAKCLGESWCTVGPLGVVGRDKGRMNTLLLGVLTALQERGLKQCVLGNVAHLEPYARHGFAERTVYREMLFRLDDPGPARMFP